MSQIGKETVNGLASPARYPLTFFLPNEPDFLPRHRSDPRRAQRRGARPRYMSCRQHMSLGHERAGAHTPAIGVNRATGPGQFLSAHGLARSLVGALRRVSSTAGSRSPPPRRWPGQKTTSPLHRKPLLRTRVLSLPELAVTAIPWTLRRPQSLCGSDGPRASPHPRRRESLAQ
jgi:hypothetical protein